MRASTQHLTESVSALATAVQNGNAQIKTELDALLQAHNDDDDQTVEASVDKIKAITASIDTAVSAAHDALAKVPADQPAAGQGAPAGDQSAPQG